MDCVRSIDREACDAPLGAAELEIQLTAQHGRSPGGECAGGVRVGDGARRFAISLAWVQATAAATARQPAAVLAESVAHQVIDAWSPIQHLERAPTVARRGKEGTFDPRDVVLLAGAILQNQHRDFNAPGRERLILVAPDGRWVSVTDGPPGATAVDAQGSLAMATPGARLTLVHNHPGGTGLSAPDILSLSQPGVQAVEAIGHDGSIYVARRGPAFRADAYATAAARFTAAARGLPLSPDLRATLAGHFAHLVSLVLHRAGAIQYQSTLAGERAHAFRRHALQLGQAVNVASHDWQKHLVQQP